MKRIEDAQTVQGALEHRIESRIEALAASAELTNRAAETLLQVAARHEERLAGVEGRLVGVEDQMSTLRDGMATIQSAMTALFNRMDRFIRGFESNGHEKGTQ